MADFENRHVFHTLCVIRQGLPMIGISGNARKVGRSEGEVSEIAREVSERKWKVNEGDNPTGRDPQDSVSA